MTYLLNPMPDVDDLGVPNSGSVGQTLESNKALCVISCVEQNSLGINTRHKIT